VRITRDLAKALALLFCAGTLCLSTAGCGASSGVIKGDTRTAVDLTKKNYRVISAGAIGTSTGFRLFGIIPLKNATFAEAKKELYDSTGADLKGKAIALVNQTEDRSSLYVILFSLPKLTISADVIEFTE